tara:strand:+ start:1067 stop:2842 length:1776 start_codon:yes stop_codon:yes gene_type:complete
MSLIHLSSQGDAGGSANRFSNYFPNPIIIEPNSQVALVNIVLTPNGSIIIDSTNNVLYFVIGSAVSSSVANPQNKVVIPIGDYTPDALATAIQNGLNNGTYQAPYRYFDGVAGTIGWQVSIVEDTTTQQPRAFEIKNTQNPQPELEGIANLANTETIGGVGYAADQMTFEAKSINDGTTKNAAGSLIGAFDWTGLTKEDVVANDTNLYQSQYRNLKGVYRGLKADGTKPKTLVYFDTMDIGGEDTFGEFCYGIARNEYTALGGTDFANNFDDVADATGTVINLPIMDIMIRNIPDGDGQGKLQVWVYNAAPTKGYIEMKTLKTGGTEYTLDGTETGHIVKFEWRTNTTYEISISTFNGSAFPAFVVLYTGTKNYKTTDNQFYELAYLKTKGLEIAIAGIYNQGILGNVVDAPLAIAHEFLHGTEAVDDSNLTAYRNKNISLSVNKLVDDTIMTFDGTIGDTIGANGALLQLTRTDATNQIAKVQTSGRPSFTSGLATAHIQLDNLPVKSYMGASSNIAKDIAIIPRFKNDNLDASDTLYYEPNEKIWIDLKNSEQITSNELSASIKNSLNKELEGIHQPTSMTLLFRKMPR